MCLVVETELTVASVRVGVVGRWAMPVVSSDETILETPVFVRWSGSKHFCPEALLLYVQNKLCNFYFYVTVIPFRNLLYVFYSNLLAYATIHP